MNDDKHNEPRDRLDREGRHREKPLRREERLRNQVWMQEIELQAVGKMVIGKSMKDLDDCTAADLRHLIKPTH